MTMPFTNVDFMCSPTSSLNKATAKPQQAKTNFLHVLVTQSLADLFIHIMDTIRGNHMFR